MSGTDNTSTTPPDFYGEPITIRPTTSLDGSGYAGLRERLEALATTHDNGGSVDLQLQDYGSALREAAAAIEALEAENARLTAAVRYQRDRGTALSVDALLVSQSKLAQAEALERRLREALHEIDVEAFNTIPSDGKAAAFAALGRIAKIINPFRPSPPST